jgi:hypothetical protein
MHLKENFKWNIYSQGIFIYLISGVLHFKSVDIQIRQEVRWRIKGRQLDEDKGRSDI